MVIAIIVAVFALAFLAVVSGVRRRDGLEIGFGWMSEQWLAEYRASHGA